MNNKIMLLSTVLSRLGFRKEASELEESVNSTTGKVEFSEILKLMPANPPTDLQDLLSSYLVEHDLKPLPAEKLHITLLNQAILKPFVKELKGKEFPQYIGPLTYGPIYSIVRDGKHSVFVVINEQGELSDYISNILDEIGIPAKPESSRIYHISLANKTGNPLDSVGHSESKPIRLEDCALVRN